VPLKLLDNSGSNGDGASRRPPSTILLIDDDEDSRVMYSAVLMRAGYRVLFARNGADGVDIATHARPDLILMDLVMPRLNGYAALRGLRDDPTTARIPVIALTGQVSQAEAPQVKEAGFEDVLVKPILPQRVLNAVQRILMDAS
jgi:CheY-like chemotaxis protein